MSNFVHNTYYTGNLAQMLWNAESWNKSLLCSGLFFCFWMFWLMLWKVVGSCGLLTKMASLFIFMSWQKVPAKQHHKKQKVFLLPDRHWVGMKYPRLLWGLMLTKGRITFDFYHHYLNIWNLVSEGRWMLLEALMTMKLIVVSFAYWVPQVCSVAQNSWRTAFVWLDHAGTTLESWHLST